MLNRLEAWLLDKDPAAAVRVGEVLEAAIASLDELPERGRTLASTARELNVKFGHSTYIVRYRVLGQRVVVTRILHGRENRLVAHRGQVQTNPQLKLSGDLK